MRRNSLFAVVVTALLVGANGQQIDRKIELDELVPQVVVNLNEDKMSSLEINVFEKNSASVDYSLSIQWANGTLQDGDTLRIGDDPYTKDSDLGPNEELLKNKTSNILISVSGEWKSSRVTLLVTIFAEANSANAPKGWFHCNAKDAQKNTKGKYIPPELICNGHQNCGQDLGNLDENYGKCEIIPSTTSKPTDGMSWYDVQYLLTILLAGLFFILSPICIVIFLFYHRRMSAARLEMQRTTGSSPEVFTTVTPVNDVPPSYEDFHDLKTPPPPFHTLPGRSSGPSTSTP